MAGLVALDLAGGPKFVDALEATWLAGDAVLPLDPRLPDAWRKRLIDTLQPTAIIGADGERRALNGTPTEPGDAVVIATSGTSGTPKGVVLTHDALEFAAFASMTYLGVEPDCHWLACLPLHHIGGFSVICRALLCSTALTVHPGFDADAVTNAAREGATHVSLVPTTMQRIEPTIFRRILLGGSRIPPDRPKNTVATYGMTESGAGVVYDGLALSGVGLRVAGDGGIELSGPTMLRCYRNGEDPKDAHGWYRTGDVGTVDHRSGRLSVHGRADDMIISGGENVWPEPIEAILGRHEAIADVAIIGRADPEWGQVVVAVIVPNDPATPPPLDELRDLVRQDLPAWCAPRAVELATSLPRTSLGKLQRRRLTDDESARPS